MASSRTWQRRWASRLPPPASSLEPLSFNVGIAFGTFVGGVVVSGPGIRAVGLVGAVLAVVAAALVGVTLALTKREESRR